jgi:hypothetical protein
LGEKNNESYQKRERQLMSNRKFIRPKDVEDLFSIKVSTLSKQRQGKYGLPYTVVGRPKNKNRGGVILYNVDEVNDYLNRKGRSTLY